MQKIEYFLFNFFDTEINATHTHTYTIFHKQEKSMHDLPSYSNISWKIKLQKRLLR